VPGAVAGCSRLAVQGVSAVLGGAEHVGLLAIAGDAGTLQVRGVGRQRRQAESTALMADDASLHDDTALGTKEPAVVECTASHE
jgi:hypothetical protein